MTVCVSCTFLKEPQSSKDMVCEPYRGGVEVGKHPIQFHQCSGFNTLISFWRKQLHGGVGHLCSCEGAWQLTATAASVISNAGSYGIRSIEPAKAASSSLGIWLGQRGHLNQGHKVSAKTFHCSWQQQHPKVSKKRYVLKESKKHRGVTLKWSEEQKSRSGLGTRYRWTTKRV